MRLAIGNISAYSPFPIEELPAAIGLASVRSCPGWCCWAALSVASAGFLHAILCRGDRLSLEYRRATAQQLAFLYHSSPLR